VILKITASSPAGSQTVDLSPWVDVQDGAGFDIANPVFTQKVFGRSLLRPGAVLALETNVEREITVPLKIGPIGGVPNAPTTLPATLQLIAQINQIGNSPGATLTWQPDGASQPTVYDGITAQVDVSYHFRREQAKWTACTLRWFAQPFGRTSGPRPYASASGVGPLLLVSPYASGGGQVIGQSTQAGVAGWGGQQQGASSGVFYWGSPSLAGDAPAQLQISYTGPSPLFYPPAVMVSLLPDKNYIPVFTAATLQASTPGGGSWALVSDQYSVASQYLLSTPSRPGGPLSFSPVPSPGVGPPLNWGGNHRLFAIARASGNPAGGRLMLQNSLVSNGGTASVVPAGDWNPYDLGTLSLRPSEYPSQQVVINSILAAGGSCALEVAAIAMLPDNATWFCSPSGPAAVAFALTSTFLIDDVLGDQFGYLLNGPPPSSAPSPTGMVPLSARITQYSRGLVPTPDPKNGLPIIAVLAGHMLASPNPQNWMTSAQINVLERTRFELP
jgi:hypothetical protein